MSRYGYDYSLAPSRQSGWRSIFRSVVMVGTVGAISAISGGVVALNLLGNGSAVADRPVAVAAQPQPASARRAQTVTPTPSRPVRAPTNAAAAVEKRSAVAAVATAAPAQPTAQPPATPAPQAAPAPKAAPASAASVEEPKTALVSSQVPESELTFTRGYARRRAVQAAAAAKADTKTDVARLEEQNQVGRAAVTKAKPRTTFAHQNGSQDQRRVADARDERPERFDFARHQALAWGDPRTNRRPPPQQQGGLFGNSSGGFFRGMF